MFLAVFAQASLAGSARGQTPAAGSRTITRRLDVGEGSEIVIRNLRGRVQITAADGDDAPPAFTVEATASAGVLTERDVTVERTGARTTVSVAASDSRARVDLVARLPARARLSIETTEGAVDVAGDFRQVTARTVTGTIRADVPSTNLRYDFRWTAARPRIYSLIPLAAPRESAGGRFQVSGRYPSRDKKDREKDRGSNSDTNADAATDASERATDDAASDEDKREESKQARRARERNAQVELDFTTARGIVVIGADPSIVPADLRPRVLTEAAKVFLRSGDEALVDPVRRLAPNLVDEYAGTLPARRSGTPTLRTATTARADGSERVTAFVTDRQGRPLANLGTDDFVVTVGGTERETIAVTPSDAPFNLVLLLDVSGSVEERLDVIRRAALRFVSTARAQDRIAVVTFRDDVRLVSDFTADRAELARRINTIEAGGATALYDALAYTLLETLPSLPVAEQERTGIVVLSDGDDNRSFLALKNVLDLTREVGSPIYPLYVPSGLIPASSSSSPQTANERVNDAPADSVIPPAASASSASSTDPVRNRSLTLTSVAADEGARLAGETGGVFYPVARLEDLQPAYDDIVRRLRTAYTITFRERADAARQTGDGEVRVRVRRPDAVVVHAGR